MENQQEEVVVNAPTNPSGAGAKIGIVIVLLVLLIGALYYFNSRKDVSPTVQTQTNEDTESLNQELDSAASADIEADLLQMEEEFNQ